MIKKILGVVGAMVASALLVVGMMVVAFVLLASISISLSGSYGSSK